MTADQLKALVGRAALAYVVPGSIVGVGTGSTVNHFIDALATIKGQIAGAVSSSVKSTERLLAHGIAVLDTNKAGVSKDMLPGTAPHALPEGNNTTHYSIVDSAGNAVSVTYTLNDWFGARVTAAGTGVLLNNEMDDFTAKLGVPNRYGLVQGQANAIAPGKRPLSSMSQTIVTQDGKTVMVLGTPGGSRIVTAVLHTLVNLIDYGMNVQEAVDAPRFHQQWLPELTHVESFALSPDTRKILEGMGHQLGPPQPANHLAAILVGAPTLGGKPVGKNRFYGANDPRRNTGLALGY